MKLTKEELRALRILSEKNAVEAEGHEIPVLKRLRELGLAEIVARRQYYSERQQITAITDAGRQAIREEDGK